MRPEPQDSDRKQNFECGLFDSPPFFESNNQTIINFNCFSKAQNNNIKSGISPWEQSQQNESSHEQQKQSNAVNLLKNRNIDHFLQTMRTTRMQKGSFRRRAKVKKLNEGDDEQTENLMKLNNTVIIFPKSRSQSHRPSIKEQRAVFEKLYKKRQKSKILPKQINLFGENHSQQNDKEVIASYKNRSFEVIDSRERQNPESEKKTPFLKKRMPSFLSRATTINVQKLSLRKWSDKKFQTKSPQAERSEEKKKFSMTFYNMNSQKKTLYELKDEAKNTHLNRVKKHQKVNMHLSGHTINNWKSVISKKIEKAEI